MRKPWFRKQNKCWYVYNPTTRRQERLGKSKVDAFRLWHKMQAAPPVDSGDPPLASLLEAFLTHSKADKPDATYRWHLAYLGPFCTACGAKAYSALKPYHLTAWLDEAKFRRGARRAAITCVKSAMNWCVDQGLVPANPFARVKKPEVGRRQQLVDDAQRKQILGRTDPEFRCFLIALSHLGCRPQEVRTVDAAKFDRRAEAWVFQPTEHKTGKKTGSKRVVFLSPCLVTLSRILAHHRPTGPLFRNSLGKPWSVTAVRLRMKRLRESLDLPAGLVAYSFRHTFTTEGLTRGVDVATMAELLGHRDTSMIDRHYGHLGQKAAHLKRAVRRAGTSPSARSPSEPPESGGASGE